MKEFLKWGFLLVVSAIVYTIYYFTDNLLYSLALPLLLLIKNQLDIEEKLNDLEENEDKERELWRAILPTRKRF